MLPAISTDALFAAEELGTGRRVTLELLAPSRLPGGPALRDDHARLAAPASPRHPAMPEILDWGQLEDGTRYVVTEEVTGRALSEVIGQDGPLDVERALDVALQVAEILEVLHNAGLVYQALRPDKVVVTDGGAIRLLDCELRGLWDHAGGPRVLPTIEAADAVSYRAPECVAGRLATERADIFGLGLLLYQMLRGTLPKRTPAGAVRSLEARRLPPPVRTIVARMLANAPEKRPADISAVANDLYEARRAWRHGGERRRRRPWRRSAGAALAVLGILVSILTIAWIARHAARPVPIAPGMGGQRIDRREEPGTADIDIGTGGHSASPSVEPEAPGPAAPATGTRARRAPSFARLPVTGSQSVSAARSRSTSGRSSGRSAGGTRRSELSPLGYTDGGSLGEGGKVPQ